MRPATRRARPLATVALASTLLVATSRATPAPSSREVAERWRKRLPGEVERLRPGKGEAARSVANRLRERLARLRDLPPAERRQKLEEARAAHAVRVSAAAGRAATSTPAARAAAPFHASGAAVCEPQPINPILDPLAIFEDETGEEPPIDSFSRYFFADFDGDGDLDVFVGDKYGYVRYLENVGTVSDPVFVERTGGASPTGSLDLSETDDDGTDEPFGSSAPTLVDIDDDDDLDLFVGTGKDEGGVVLFFENQNGTLVRNDDENPLGAFEFGSGMAAPHFADFDGDGDFDAFVGTKVGDDAVYSEVYFVRNEGTPAAPSFVDQTEQPGIDPLAGVSFVPFTVPFVADIDGDDDLDVFVGNFFVTRFFRNTGGVLVEEADPYANPLAGSGLTFPAPVLVDIDDDGDLDAFLGGGLDKSTTGGAFFFENTGDADSPAFLSTARHVELTDVDGDGDLDALAGLKLLSSEGLEDCECELFEGLGVALFLNTGTPETPRWELQSGADNPFWAFNGTFEGTDAAPTVGDLDGDGHLEAFVGDYYGYLTFLELNPVSGQFEPGVHPLAAGYSFGYFADPHLADLNGDGELDLVVGYSDYTDYAPRVAVFLNPPGPGELGDSLVPDFVVDFPGIEEATAQPTLADVDGDGDLDLLVGVGYETYFGIAYQTQVLLVENTGDPGNPAFDGSTAQPIAVAQSDAGSPAAGDLNGDGLLDIVLGSLAGAEVFLTDGIGVTVDPTSVVTTETGLADTFTVVLDRAPAGTVILDVTSSNPAEGTVSPVQLTFGPGDWNVPQTVTVTGVDDPDADGPQLYDVTLMASPLSAEPCVGPATVAAVNLDDEAALLTAIKQITGGTLSSGGTVTYTLTVTNVGGETQPDTPGEAELVDDLPPTLTLVGAELISGPGFVTTTANTVRWDGSLAPGASATIEVTATIGPGLAGATILNQAIAASDNDGDGGNESELPSDDPTTPEPGDPTAFAAGQASIVEVPALSGLGAALLAGLLSLLGFLGLRWRQ